MLIVISHIANSYNANDALNYRRDFLTSLKPWPKKKNLFGFAQLNQVTLNDMKKW